MNCNPFTLGHQFLIQEAMQHVDHLFIFVVEENKSVFSFRDRMQMVLAGTSQYCNVHVFPSGKYMISSTTLPGYFDKKHLGNIEVSASEDLEIFATIASALHIRVRFAGTEPKDGFTNSYNHAMREKLPLYGIDFFEIPRKTLGRDKVISATRVRELIEMGDRRELTDYLPDTTIDILEMYGYI